MRTLVIPSVVLALLGVGLAAMNVHSAEPTVQLSWSDLAPLPNPVGLGGPIVGTHRGALIVAGGANFPDGPPWEVDGKPAGEKVWHSKIYVLPETGGKWKVAGELPYPLAYAAVVSADEGVYILGGETFGRLTDDQAATNYPTAEVLRLEYDPNSAKVAIVRDALPDLPKPCRYHAAAIADATIYLAASHPVGTGAVLGEKEFRRLDLSLPATERSWKRRLSWPGLAREKHSLLVQSEARGKQGLFLLGGSRWVKDSSGAFDFARFRYFDDVHRKEIPTNRWNSGRLATMPKSLAASPAIAVGDRYILVFSGDTGEFLDVPNQDRQPFGRQVYCFDTHRNQWKQLADMPVGVVTTSAVWWRDQIVIVSGETRPGIRSPRVQSAKVQLSKNH